MSNEFTVSMQLATLAMRLEHLNARAEAANVARIGAGSSTVFSTQLDGAYAAMRSAAATSPEAVDALAREAAQNLDGFAGLSQMDTRVTASLDDALMALARKSSRYGALADAIGRQYSLMTLAIRGAR